MISKKKYYYLDYLRGIAAFGIMIYHYLSWTYGDFSVNSLFGKIGLYGVSVFYILSGLTLQINYGQNHFNLVNMKRFFIKRIFRIFPLLILAIFLTISINRSVPDFYTLIINLTGIFGFIDWNNWIAIGSWSIGNELVFYAVFPFLIILTQKNKKLFFILLFLFLIIYIFFAWRLIVDNLSFQKYYVHPLNQILLFALGILIGVMKLNIQKLFALFLLLTSMLIFYFLQSSGVQVILVTKWDRIILTSVCFLIVFALFHLENYKNLKILKPFSLLGDISYSVYLLNPICYTLTGLVFQYYFNENYPILKIILAVILNLILSYFVFNYFEKKFVKIGKKYLNS